MPINADLVKRGADNKDTETEIELEKIELTEVSQDGEEHCIQLRPVETTVSKIITVFKGNFDF